MRLSFADLLARAEKARASIRIEPKICPRSGLTTFVAVIHGECGRPSKYAVTGTQVVSIDVEATDRVMQL